MWKIKDVKKNGKKHFKNNVWTLLLVTVVMTFIVGEYFTSKKSFSNIRILQEFIIDRQNNEKIETFDDNPTIILNKYFDEAISSFVSNRKEGLIEQYNQKHNVYKGVAYTIFNAFTIGQNQLKELVNSIWNSPNKTAIQNAIIISLAVIAMLLKVFVSNPILVGESRIYLESINYKKTKIRRLFYTFRKKRYINVVIAVLLMHLYKFFWNLTIIGGFIKNYSYKMVTYIMAENPEIKPRDAIKMSRIMMNGAKWKLFELDISFLGWNILAFITFGISSLYSSPYYKLTLTEIYRLQREEYKRKKLFNYEMLNDDVLFDRELLKTTYKELTNEDIESIQNYPGTFRIVKNKPQFEFHHEYDLVSLILLFFVFSIAGWCWEVLLFMFRDGKFVNRGTLYGPWLPIYGVGCTLFIILLQIGGEKNHFSKIANKPFLTFIAIAIVASIVEYFSSFWLEAITGMKYWNYEGIFMNLNGRICLEGAIFFGLGGSFCLYIVAPFIHKKINKISQSKKIAVCIILIILMTLDKSITLVYPHQGEGITEYAKTDIEDSIHDNN